MDFETLRALNLFLNDHRTKEIQSSLPFSKLEKFYLKRSDFNNLFFVTILSNGENMKKLKIDRDSIWSSRTSPENQVFLNISGEFESRGENSLENCYYLPNLEDLHFYGCGLNISKCQKLRILRFDVCFSCWELETTHRRYLSVKKCSSLEDIIVHFNNWYTFEDHLLDLEFEELECWNRFFLDSMITETIGSCISSQGKTGINLRFLEIEMGVIDGECFDDDGEPFIPLRNQFCVDGNVFPNLEVLVINDCNQNEEIYVTRLRALESLKKLKKLRITNNLHLRIPLFQSVIGMSEEDFERVIVLADLEEKNNPETKLVSIAGNGKNGTYFSKIEDQQEQEKVWKGNLKQYLVFLDSRNVRIEVLEKM